MDCLPLTRCALQVALESRVVDVADVAAMVAPGTPPSGTPRASL